MKRSLNINKIDKSYFITGVGLFDSDVIFDCGQCFRWYKKDDYWHGISSKKYAKVKTIEDGIELVCKDEDLNYWINYLDLEYDYKTAKEALLKDSDLAPLVDYLPGMRFLNQDFFECLISFIISANNNVKRIRSIIERISTAYGESLEQGYAFPTPQALANLKDEDLLACGAGYRANYIVVTANLFAKGYDYESLSTRDLESARKELTVFKGVGIKVADCVLLFSMKRKDAFPVDTWIRKVMQELCNEKLSDNKIRSYAAVRFGENAGLANQYLFHINRTGS